MNGSNVLQLVLLTMISVTGTSPSYYEFDVPGSDQAFSNFTVIKNSFDHDPYTYLIRAVGYLPSVLIPSRNKLIRTSEQSKHAHCASASNGGPFEKDGAPVGIVVSEGQISPGSQFSRGNVGFGITKAPNRRWIIGTVNEEEVRRLELENYVTGFDWLVENGINVAPFRNNTTGAVIAPRTAIGIDSGGRLMMLVADGCEKCLERRRRGLELVQVASILQSHGARFAINLDGGGSSTLIVNGNIANISTCKDIPLKCERPVSSVICLQHPHGEVNSEASARPPFSESH